MFKVIKIGNNIIREKINITKFCFRLHKKQKLNWYGHLQGMNEERLPQKILVSTREKKNTKTSKFVDAGSNNRNERDGN